MSFGIIRLRTGQVEVEWFLHVSFVHHLVAKESSCAPRCSQTVCSSFGTPFWRRCSDGQIAFWLYIQVDRGEDLERML